MADFEGIPFDETIVMESSMTSPTVKPQTQGSMPAYRHVERYPLRLCFLFDKDLVAVECLKEANRQILEKLSEDHHLSNVFKRAFFAAMAEDMGDKMSQLQFKVFVRDAKLIDLGVSLSAINIMFGNVTKPLSYMNETSFSLSLYFLASMIFREDPDDDLRHVHKFSDEVLSPYIKSLLPIWSDPEVWWSIDDVTVQRSLYMHHEGLRQLFDMISVKGDHLKTPKKPTKPSIDTPRFSRRTRIASVLDIMRESHDQVNAEASKPLPEKHPEYFRTGSHCTRAVTLTALSRFISSMRLPKVNNGDIIRVTKTSSMMFPHHFLRCRFTAQQKARLDEEPFLLFPEFCDSLVRLAVLAFEPSEVGSIVRMKSLDERSLSSKTLQKLRQTRARTVSGVRQNEREAKTSFCRHLVDAMRLLFDLHVADIYFEATQIKFSTTVIDAPPIRQAENGKQCFLPLPQPTRLRLSDDDIVEGCASTEYRPLRGTVIVTSEDEVSDIILTGERFDCRQGVFVALSVDGYSAQPLVQLRSFKTSPRCVSFLVPSLRDIVARAEELNLEFTTSMVHFCKTDAAKRTRVFRRKLFGVSLHYSNDGIDWVTLGTNQEKSSIGDRQESNYVKRQQANPFELIYEQAIKPLLISPTLVERLRSVVSKIASAGDPLNPGYITRDKWDVLCTNGVGWRLSHLQVSSAFYAYCKVCGAPPEPQYKEALTMDGTISALLHIFTTRNSLVSDDVAWENFIESTIERFEDDADAATSLKRCADVASNSPPTLRKTESMVQLSAGLRTNQVVSLASNPARLTRELRMTLPRECPEFDVFLGPLRVGRVKALTDGQAGLVRWVPDRQSLISPRTPRSFLAGTTTKRLSDEKSNWEHPFLDFTAFEAIQKPEVKRALLLCQEFIPTLRRLRACGAHLLSPCERSHDVLKARLWNLIQDGECCGALCTIPGQIATLNWVPISDDLKSPIASLTLYKLEHDTPQFAAICAVYLSCTSSIAELREALMSLGYELEVVYPS